MPILLSIREEMTNVNLGSPEQHVWVQRCTALSNARKGGVHHGIFKVKMGSFLCIVTVIFLPGTHLRQLRPKTRWWRSTRRSWSRRQDLKKGRRRRTELEEALQYFLLDLQLFQFPPLEYVNACCTCILLLNAIARHEASLHSGRILTCCDV